MSREDSLSELLSGFLYPEETDDGGDEDEEPDSEDSMVLLGTERTDDSDSDLESVQAQSAETSDSKTENVYEDMDDHDFSANEPEVEQSVEETSSRTVSSQQVEEDVTEPGPSQKQGPSQNVHTSGSDTRHGQYDGSSDVFMELPDTCVTETEDPDADAPIEELLPDILPGWKLQKTDSYRWKVPVAEDWITGTYVDSFGGRYMVHVSRWKPDHVQYAMDELLGKGEPTRFDVWTARGRFVFGVKIAGGTIDQAKTLLTACPPLSKSYLGMDGGEHS